MADISDNSIDFPNQQEHNHKLCNEKGHSFLILKESQWKLNEAYVELIFGYEERNLKEQNRESHSQRYYSEP